MSEAYLIENGEITEPLREGNLIGNGPQVLRDIDMLADDFAMGSPGTCGKDGQGVPVGDGQPTLRVKSLTIGGHRAMSGTASTRSRSARRRARWRSPIEVVAQAQPGEQLEAYVARGGETEIRVYEGEVEHFVSAQSEGIGIRVIRDGRTGFAYAGTLDVRRRRRGARRGARQRRVRHRRRVGRAGRARRRRPSPSSRCGTTTSRRFATDAQDRPGQGARAADARPPTSASASTTPTTPTRGARSAVATTTGIRAVGSRERLLRAACRRSPTTATRRRPGSGSASAAQPERVRPRQGVARGGRSGDPAARRHEAAVAAAHRRARPVRHRPVPRHHLARRSTARRSSRAAACSATASASRSRRRVVTLVDDPTNPLALHGDRRRRRGSRRPPQRADRRRRRCSVRAQLVLGPPGRHGVDRQRRARRVRRHARRRVPRPVARARARATRTSSSPTSTTVCSCRACTGMHSGVNPISGDFSTGASGC